MTKLKTIIITGATGTIGKAAAHLFTQQGYHLLLADKKEESLIALSKSVPNSTISLIDVTNPHAMENLFNSVAENLVSVVLASGIEGPIGPLEECNDTFFQDVMHTNVMGVWLGIKHALRIFKPKNFGSIVVLSSISGITPMPMLSAYCASKHAVIGLVKTAAREAAGYGIRINAVCPGPVVSTMMERIDDKLSELFPDRINAMRSIPMKRYATPEEIASMIAFLCSDASKYCTGTTMTVDGGLTCK